MQMKAKYIDTCCSSISGEYSAVVAAFWGGDGGVSIVGGGHGCQL
jgi:hypothetical protein